MATARLDHYDGSVPVQEQRFSDDAADLAASIGSSIRTRSMSPVRKGLLVKYGLEDIGRRTLGICLLLVTVFLWTLSNFLASVSFVQADITDLRRLLRNDTVHLLRPYLRQAIFLGLREHFCFCNFIDTHVYEIFAAKRNSWATNRCSSDVA